MKRKKRIRLAEKALREIGEYLEDREEKGLIEMTYGRLTEAGCGCIGAHIDRWYEGEGEGGICLLYTSPSPRD